MAKRHDLLSDIERIELPAASSLRRGRGMDGIILPQHDDAITLGTETELSDDERDELQRCESIIERGIKTFFAVGTALMRVRDLRLYRVHSPTFEAYCQERWDFSKTYANNLIASTSARDNLTTIVVKQLPTNEAQVRPLTRLKEPDQQRQAWQSAVERAEERDLRITAALVETIIRELYQSPPATEPPAEGMHDNHSLQYPMSHAIPQDEVQRLQQRLNHAVAIIEAYQDQITRAQTYPPTSERGDAVSPLLRALEQMWQVLHEDSPSPLMVRV